MKTVSLNQGCVADGSAKWGWEVWGPYEPDFIDSDVARDYIGYARNLKQAEKLALDYLYPATA